MLQFRSQHTKFILKNNTILIENTDEHTIFVDVKTAYLSHRHNNFWDTKPVKHMNICGAPGGDDRSPTKIRQRS